MSAILVPRLTPEQYLEIERNAEFKSEYFDGEMFAMSGGLLPHALVSAALVTALSVALRGRNCRVAGSDLRIGVSKSGPFFYPDATVYCGEPQLADDFKDTLLNPALVIEVLSPSSEAYDRGKKFAAYRKIDSLREYVLVSQNEAIIESYVRQPDTSSPNWTLTEFSGKDAVCGLKSIAVEIALAEIYRDIA
jgi:Uma2 family endonuclease